MNFRRQRRRRPIAELELTPLIDIIFQLLIFFLITTTFVSTPGMSIDRPKASNSGKLDRERLTVDIPKGFEGSVMFQGKRLSYVQFEEVMKKLYKKQSEAQIAIDADANVAHHIVVKVMDILTGVGFHRIGIITSPETTPNK